MPVVLAIAIIWGCALRFYDLDANFYWQDEVFSSLRVAGYLRQELAEEGFQGQVIYPAELLRFQSITPDKRMIDTIASLADDVHPPGYFVLLRLWAGRFGTSIAAMRSFSAAVSLLLLPVAYGLAMTLFERSPARHSIAWLTVAITAVSPYQMQLAGEARMYSLWSVLAATGGIFLVRALRHNRRADWILYGLMAVLCLYTHWFSVLVLAGYSLYALIVNDFKWTRPLKTYVFVSVIAGLAILPWLLFVGSRMSELYHQTRWTEGELPLIGSNSSLYLWLNHAALIFLNPEALSTSLVMRSLVGLFAIALIAWSMWRLTRQTPKSVWAFVLIASGMTFVPLMLADVILGGRRSTIFRYMAPSLVAIAIAVAFGIVWLLTKAERQKTALIIQGSVVALLIGGNLSQSIAKATFVQTEPLVQVAAAINSASEPRLLSDYRGATSLLSLAHLLKADTQMQVTLRPQRPVLTDAAGRTIFLYQASDELQADVIEQGYRLNPVPDTDQLLQLQLAR